MFAGVSSFEREILHAVLELHCLCVCQLSMSAGSGFACQIIQSCSQLASLADSLMVGLGNLPGEASPRAFSRFDSLSTRVSISCLKGLTSPFRRFQCLVST